MKTNDYAYVHAHAPVRLRQEGIKYMTHVLRHVVSGYRSMVLSRIMMSVNLRMEAYVRLICCKSSVLWIT